MLLRATSGTMPSSLQLLSQSIMEQETPRLIPSEFTKNESKQYSK